MPLGPHILWSWLITTVLATAIVRAAAIALRKWPRAYAGLWICAVTVVGTQAIVAFYYLATPHREGHGPGAMPTPIELLLLLILPQAASAAVPRLVALGLSPPGYRERRWVWWLGAMLVLAAVGLGTILFVWDVQYRNKVRPLEAAAKHLVEKQVAWETIGPPNPQIGPQRSGEWKYLGAGVSYVAGFKDGVYEQYVYRLDFDGQPRRDVPAFQAEAFKWLKNEKRLAELVFSRMLTDDDVAQLTPLVGLKHLTLVDTGITDRGMAALKSLASLQSLHLSGPLVTATTLEVIAEFPKLKLVDVSKSRITDAELQAFCGRHPAWKAKERKLGRE